MKTLKLNDKFGKLTVQYYDVKRKKWYCKCDCGGSTYSRAWELKKGRHKSCSCGQTDPRPLRRLPDNESLKRGVYKGYRESAKRRNHKFKLSEFDFFRMIMESCFYCGAEPNSAWLHERYKGRNFKYNGVDRIDNGEGYTKENCVTCCDICNNSKSTLSLEAWKSWIKKVYEKQKL